jgi:hypothetical protein
MTGSQGKSKGRARKKIDVSTTRAQDTGRGVARSTWQIRRRPDRPAKI